MPNRNLNDEQKKAIEADGNVLLVGCPGSGKTYTLIHKIVDELEKINTHRQFVVALTYTNVAADEIRDRVGKLGVGIDQLWIGTIHSFCLEWIINPYYIYHDKLRYGFRIVDTKEGEDLLDVCAKSEGLKSHYDCNHYVIPDSSIFEVKNNKNAECARKAITAYHSELHKIHAIDFQLLLRYAYELIRDRKEISERLNQLFSIIAVDEYQDTLLIQYEILSYIFKANTSHTRLFMVGDPNQAIFSSLGGVALEQNDIESRTGLLLDKHELVKNYRSSQKIIDYYSHFMVKKMELESAGMYKTHNSFIVFNSSIEKSKVGQYIADIIKYNIEYLNIDPSEICVVAPQWGYLSPLNRCLVSLLPEYNFNGPGLSPFGRNRDNFWYKVARLALTKPSPEIFNKRMYWAQEILQYLRRECNLSPEVSGRDLLLISNSIIDGLSTYSDSSSGIEYLIKYFNIFIETLNISLIAGTEITTQLENFCTRTREQLKKKINDFENIDADTLENYKKFFQPYTGITVSTIHGVKGEEYDTVIAFGLLEGVVPHFSEVEKDKSAKRTMFVVGSRARKNLWLIAERSLDRYKRVRQPSGILRSYQYAYDDPPYAYDDPS